MPVDEELRRVLPVVEALAADGVAVSIDTRKAEVAEAAVAAGARLVNDVTRLARRGGRRHRRRLRGHAHAGRPRTMQDDPRYDDVVAEVRDYLVDRADAARAAGVAEVWIDPGIGFGKTLDHNLDLLANLDVLVATGYPVLVGTSRKRCWATLAARADPRRRRAAPGRPAGGLGGDRGVGAAAGRGDGAGPRRAGATVQALGGRGGVQLTARETETWQR